jgi:hypothetical protein
MRIMGHILQQPVPAKPDEFAETKPELQRPYEGSI